jgi:GTP-binding protein Era
MTSFKAGYISILGRPNVGKSTLFNRILGDRISIVTAKPQTTRNRILGIRNTAESQMIFLDTPGLHKARTRLNEHMVAAAVASSQEADVLLFLIEATSPDAAADGQLIESLKASRGIPFLVINKIDLIPRTTLLPIIDHYRQIHPFEEILPISAETGEGIERLLGEIEKRLPESPPFYPEDQITDQTERFIASEFIREKVINETRQEIPYSTAVTVESYKEKPEKSLLVIQATIHVEKDSHRKILIGRGGQKLKRIGEGARKEIEAFTNRKVFLELWVNVEKNWTRDPQALRRLGYE